MNPSIKFAGTNGTDYTLYRRSVYIRPGVDDRIIADLFGHSDARSVLPYAKVQTAVVRNATGATQARDVVNVSKSQLPKLLNPKTKLIEMAGIEPASTKIELGTYSDYWCLRGASRTSALVTL